jgi:hypothetical protein
LLTKIDYPIQTLAFGDSLAMVFLAGEICVDYALRLKEELDSTRLWLHGYANDFCCYIPSERLLKEGGYGGGAEIVYFALPNTLQPRLEERIISEVHRQVPSRFKAEEGGKQETSAGGRTLEQALASIKVKEDYVVEVAAAEPLVADPVAIDFGPDGRLWVAEMPDYTRYPDEEFEPHGGRQSSTPIATSTSAIAVTPLTVDGLSHAGILHDETSTSVTLLEQQGNRRTLLRGELESLENSGKSLMPEGLERDLSPTDVSDLLAYLATTAHAAKTIEGNEPAVVTPDYDGTLWLMAAGAEIYGGQITFEQTFQNIGYWHEASDHVAWTVDLPDGGQYEAYLHWACAGDSAGNGFVVEGVTPELKRVVGGTGGYDRYRTIRLGQFHCLRARAESAFGPTAASRSRT